MEKVPLISSIQNPWVRKVLSLRVKSRERKAARRFVLEGERELEMAVKGGYTLETVFFCPEIATETKFPALMKVLRADTTCISVSQEVYAKMAYRGNTQGILAIAECRDHDLAGLILPKKDPLILVAEAPEKPGNIGALLRTADAAALDAVIIANPKTDLYNPNIVRSSVGCLFTTRICTGTTTEVIAYLKSQGCKLFCAALSASRSYTQVDFTGPSAIVVGTESDGLSEEWLREAYSNVIIPMEGQIDSMNVSVSAAILIFEAKRQRAAEHRTE